MAKEYIKPENVVIDQAISYCCFLDFVATNTEFGWNDTIDITQKLGWYEEEHTEIGKFIEDISVFKDNNQYLIQEMINAIFDNYSLNKEKTLVIYYE